MASLNSDNKILLKNNNDNNNIKTFDSLTHQFSLVSRQVESGLYSIKRLTNYLKKLCTYEEDYAKNVLKSTIHETDKLEKTHGDGMNRYFSAWITLQEVIYQKAMQHQEYRNKITSSVILPLLAFYKEAENKRKEILNDMKHLKQHIKSVKQSVVKNRDKALHALHVLKSAMDRDRHEHSSQAADRSLFSKLSTKLQTITTDSIPVLKDKAVNACQSYQTTIENANRENKQYQLISLPAIFQRLHSLEMARLDVLKDHLSKFGQVHHDLVSPLEEFSTRLANSINEMDTIADINNFVNNWISIHGEAVKEKPLGYDLPCNGDDLKKDRWTGSLELKVEASIFGSSLETVMSLQQEKYPNEEVPVLLTKLIQAIRDRDGCNTEGIFRLSAPKAELDQLHREFDKGNYEVPNTSSVHVPAGLLKEWLRELAEPLIPPELYQPAVESVKVEVENPDVLQIFKQLPNVNKLVIKSLCNLLRDITANFEFNKMNVENISIVFAPSFLRCESDDPMEMMMNSKYETKFVKELFKNLFKTIK